MKKILVPTDFSDNARNALAHAIEIANLFGGQIHLLHAYRMPSRAGMFKSVESYMLDEIRPQMQDWEEWTKERLTGGGEVGHTILRDDFIHAVSAVASKQAIDLIVMGTQGASGIKEVFLGSNTGMILKHCRLPLLAIPSGFAFRPIRTIVLAIDDQDISSRQVLVPLSGLAKALQSKVLVYHVEKEEDAGIDPSVSQFLEDLEFSLHYESDTSDFNKKLNAFVHDQQADLLCMVRRPKWIFERLFGGSVTLKTVFNSPVPLLVLRDN
jgi:nucleotide-binding universal stress UspA family protein